MSKTHQEKRRPASIVPLSNSDSVGAHGKSVQGIAIAAENDHLKVDKKESRILGKQKISKT